jgi:hypothetical protein
MDKYGGVYWYFYLTESEGSWQWMCCRLRKGEHTQATDCVQIHNRFYQCYRPLDFLPPEAEALARQVVGVWQGGEK